MCRQIIDAPFFSAYEWLQICSTSTFLIDLGRRCVLLGGKCFLYGERVDFLEFLFQGGVNLHTHRPQNIYEKIGCCEE